MRFLGNAGAVRRLLKKSLRDCVGQGFGQPADGRLDTRLVTIRLLLGGAHPDIGVAMCLSPGVNVSTSDGTKASQEALVLTLTNAGAHE
jgi:hypothetical protein